MDKKIDELPFGDNTYDVVGGEIKESDYVVNTIIKNAIPMKVIKQDGKLGVSPGGFFNWMPLRECHKKIKWRE